MSLSKRTQVKHDKMIAEAEEDIWKGKTHSKEAVREIIQSWKKEDFETNKLIIKELEIGEKSGFVEDFDTVENLKKLHKKHLTKPQ